ncbi:MAG: nucleoside deaminase [Clostridia bacterium]|nr:nucleoside deaminase [Clostridia bacterium]
MTVTEHERWMREALSLARTARDAGEVPVGTVIVKEGLKVAEAYNMRESLRDPTAHAEMLALRGAAKNLGARRLKGCTIYVTLEPCPMCAGAILLARPDTLVFGAYDIHSGCCGSVYRLTEDAALRLGGVPAHGGVLESECASMLQDFFKQRR